MDSMLEQIPYALPTYLGDKVAWEEKLGENAHSRNWATAELLDSHIETELERALSFANLPDTERAAFARTTGRILVGLANHSFYGIGTSDKARLEVASLVSAYGHSAEAAAAPYIDLISFFQARERNTNTAGATGMTFSGMIKGVAQRSIERGDAITCEGIANPFMLASGDAPVRFEEKAGVLESFPIDVLVEDGKGLVVFGKGPDDQEDLDAFNRKISRGYYMLRSGENIFGGKAYLENQTHADLLYPGSSIRIDATTPLDTEKKIEKAIVVSTNRAELEEKYGNAYLAFLDKFPRGKGILRATVEMPDGRVIRDIDVRDLNIVA